MSRDARVPKWSPYATVRNLGGRLKVLHGPDGWELSELGGVIWRLCDGRHSVDDIAAAIVAEYQVDEDVARADALEFLEDMERSDLIRWTAPGGVSGR